MMGDGGTKASSDADGRLNRALTYLRTRPRLRLGILLALPATVLVGLFVLPLLSMISLSFLTGLPPAPFTLENYGTIFGTSLYITVIWRTATITAITTAIVVVLGYTFAYSVVRFSRYTSVLLLLVILPFWTNYIVRMYAWMNILQTGGVLDTILMATGVVAEPVSLLYSQTAVLIGFTYIWLPLSTLAFYASITNLDTDMIDAAKDLGAGPIKTFFVVTLPLTKSGLVVGTILVAIPTFGAFITPALLGGTNSIMIGMVIEEQFIDSFNWPLGAALSVVVSIVAVLITVAAAALGGNALSRGAAE